MKQSSINIYCVMTLFSFKGELLLQSNWKPSVNGSYRKAAIGRLPFKNLAFQLVCRVQRENGHLCL